jgi:hypothetical protein
MFSAGVCFGFRPHSQSVFFYLMISKEKGYINLRLFSAYSGYLVPVYFGKGIVRRNCDCQGGDLLERIPGGGCGG